MTCPPRCGCNELVVGVGDRGDGCLNPGLVQDKGIFF